MQLECTLSAILGKSELHLASYDLVAPTSEKLPLYISVSSGHSPLGLLHLGEVGRVFLASDLIPEKGKLFPKKSVCEPVQFFVGSPPFRSPASEVLTLRGYSLRASL